EGWADNKVTKAVTEIYLEPVRKRSVDTLILGCTHYPILKKILGRVMGKDVVLVDSAREVAKEAREILDAGGLLNGSKSKGKHRFFVSDEPNRFVRIGERFLNRRIDCAKRAV
ncbi:MAG: glutamate racemase, partial [Candidatus Omnitrophica bacterium]|nr:glutamate racemase [Candidatus Omnitrophota bacterium]